MIQHLLELLGYLPEAGSIFNHRISDAVNISRSLGNGNLRIDQFSLYTPRAVREYFDNRYFYDSVCTKVSAGGFQVYERKRFCQLQHRINISLKNCGKGSGL
jgi:hypothetical protein